jgi:hypothetical protein
MNIRLPFHIFGCGAALLNQHKLIIFGGKNANNQKIHDSVTLIHLGTGEYKNLKNLTMPCYTIFPVIRENNLYYIYHYGDESKCLPTQLIYEISY